MDKAARFMDDGDLKAWFRTKAARAVGANDVDKQNQAVAIVLDPKAEALFFLLQLIS